MQIYMRICPKCVAEHHQVGRFGVAGWIDYFKSEEVIYDGLPCLYHPDQPYIKMAMTCEEFQILKKISLDPAFMQAMNDLKEKDIIEYNTKLAQFKTQVEQEESRPKCPHCKSTNIKPISTGERVGSVAVWGLFSKKINKSYKCNDCKYTW